MYFIDSNGPSTLASNHCKGKLPTRDRPPGGDKKLRARQRDASANSKIRRPPGGERKLRRVGGVLVLLGACQKKLMAEDARVQGS